MSIHHCDRVLDGKHTAIQASLFFKDKKSSSIVLLALCNASCQFTVADIREAVRQSDGRVFLNTDSGCSFANGYFKFSEANKALK